MEVVSLAGKSSKQAKSSKKKEPKSALKKRDTKAESKKPKLVKISSTVEVHEYYERTWNDHKRKDLIKGAFTENEVGKLLDALCAYAKSQESPEDTLILLCSKSKQELP